MKRFILSVATVALVVAVTSSAALATGPRSASSRSSGSQRTFQNQGRSFSSHFYSRSYSGWSRYCWFSNYGCYGYYCPTQCCWYYYCPSQTCYLPVSYMSTFAPTAVNTNQNTNTNVNTNVNVIGNNSPGLPVGATALPVGAVPQGPVSGAPFVGGPRVQMPRALHKADPA